MSPTAADLERLHRRLIEGFNPFEHRVVQTPWDPIPYPDVRSIHGSVSDEILSLIRHTHEDGAARFVLLRGTPGIGKTHLLRRLRVELGALGTFVVIGPFGEGRRLYRHILRQLCESLDHRRTEEVPRLQLQEFALQVLGRAAADLPMTDWIRQRLARDPAYLIEVLAQHTDPVKLRDRVLARHPGVDRDVVTGLFAMLDVDRMGLAARWLQGVELPDEDLAVLRIGDAVTEEDRAHEVLRSLIQLSRDSFPLVICFDQLEFLPAVDGEPGFVALAKVAAQLAMAGRVVLLVSCLVETWEEYRKRLPGSAVDRIAQNSFVLEPPTADQIAEVLSTRLHALYGPLRPPDPAYPFGQEVSGELAAEPGISVRRVLERAGRTLEDMRRRKRISLVRSLRSGPPTVPFEVWLDGEVRRRVTALQSGGKLPLDEGLVKRGLGLALDLARRKILPLGPLAVRAVDESPARSRYLHLTAEFEVEPGTRLIGFCFCNTENARSFVAHCEHLLKEFTDGRRGLGGAVLLRDERLADLPLTWKKSREALRAFATGGGSFLRLDLDTLARLETLRTLLADAAAGDLSGPDRPATREDVEAAVLRTRLTQDAKLWGRLAETLSPLARGPAPGLKDALIEAARRKRVMPWSRLHESLPPDLRGVERKAVLLAAQAAPGQILVLDPDGEDPVFCWQP
jgi:hypothetical protein